MKKRKLFSLILSLMLLFTMTGIPEAQALAAGTGEAVSVYTVQGGDCLYGIAKSLYGDGERWQEIYGLNRNEIKDPKIIYKGQNLLIPQASVSESDAQKQDDPAGVAAVMNAAAEAQSAALNADTVQSDAAALQAKADVLAEGIYSKTSAVEPQVTAIMKSMKSKDAHLAGLDFRLKTRESISRKLVTNSKDMEVSLEEAVPTIKDALRYTMVIDEEDYARITAQLLDDLIARGYAITKFRNYWKEEGYQGINTFIRTPDGIIFELQFHTEKSYDTKEKEHVLYEKIRSDSASEEEKAALTKESNAVYAQVPVPPEALSLDYTSKVVQ